MQMMICCISKGYKVYESIRTAASCAHIAYFSESGRCVSAMYLMILSSSKKKREVIIYEAVWTLLQMWRHLRAGRARQVGGTISPYWGCCRCPLPTLLKVLWYFSTLVLFGYSICWYFFWYCSKYSSL